MRLSEVPHQARAVSVIRRALRSGRTHHAYLFDGPAGVGKERAARALAARLLCEAESRAPDADACGECRACRLLASGNHPDFHDVHRGLHKFHPDRSIRTSKGLFLVVEVIRRFLIEPAGNTPALGRRRIFLIRQAERMNEQAQNALLKTLEEPPGQACLILVTSSASRLLATIRSRCQRIPFDLLPPDYVETQLAAQTGLEPAAARTLAGLAQGQLGVALRWQRIGLLDGLAEVTACVGTPSDRGPEEVGAALVESATALAQRAMKLSQLDEDLGPGDELEERGGAGKGRTTSKTVPTDELRDALKLVLMLVAALYRDALVMSSASADRGCFLSAQPELVRGLAQSATPEQLDSAIQAVADAERMLDRNVAPQLACERLAVALSGEVALR